MKRPIYTLGLIATLCCVATACNRAPRNTSCDVVEETYVHKYGVSIPAQDWTARGEDGQVISTMKDGVVVTKHFSGGTLNGDTTYTFPHSNLIEKVESYSNGTLAKETHYYQSGVPAQETIHQSDDGYTHTVWYENGSPKSIENYNSFGLAQGQYYDGRNMMETRVDNGEGVRNVRDGYGQLLSRDTIHNGNMTTRTTYHPNGSPKEITPYVNGVIHGELRTYLPAGEPNTIEQWADGSQTGKSIQYVNGEKFSEANYVNGVKNGPEYRFRDGNDVTHEITWKDNQKHGPTTSFVGETPQTEWYHQDKPVSKSKFDSMSGALAK
jgi:antitoxin component YwqK of YwqJK toxin-antitoxin module